MDDRFPAIDFQRYHRRELPDLLASGRGVLAARAAAGLATLAFRVGDKAFAYRVDGDSIHIEPGTDGAAAVIGLSQQHWQDLVHDLESAPSLIYGKLLTPVAGDMNLLMRWEPALRAMYRGIPPYDASMAQLHDSQGRALAADQAFDLDDADADMIEFLQAAGYLLLQKVFSEAEIATLRQEALLLAGQARQGDQTSWWGKNAQGAAVLTRVLQAGTQPTMAGLYGDPRIARLGRLPPHELYPSGADAVDGITVVYKNPAMTEGLSDLPWHRDCGMGGHALTCPAVVLSIYLYDATTAAGELRFLPGSHNACVGFMDAGLPHAPEGVRVAACAGDVTLHYSDVMHAAPPPTADAGPFRQSVLLSYAPHYQHHRGGRHYNDVLLENNEDGQIERLT